MVVVVWIQLYIASGRWCEGEKAFPPKIRRGTFERRAGNNDEDAIMEKDKKMKTKMKTKMNKKCAAQQNDNNKEEEEEGEEGEEKETKDGVENVSNGGSNIAKKRARGVVQLLCFKKKKNVLMHLFW